MKKTVDIDGSKVKIDFSIIHVGESRTTPCATKKGWEVTERDCWVFINHEKTPALRIGTRRVEFGVKGVINSVVRYRGKDYKSEKKLAEAILSDRKASL